MSAIKRCPECDSVSLNFDPHLGEIICNDCGLVVEEKMVDTGVDLSGKFDKSEKKGRGGAPMSMQKLTYIVVFPAQVKPEGLGIFPPLKGNLAFRNHCRPSNDLIVPFVDGKNY